MNTLENIVVLVTGAAQGNGEGIARAMAKRGAMVILTDVSEKVLQTANKLMRAGYKAVGFRMDVTKADEVNSTFRKALDDYKKIDVLVNNAGIYPDEPPIQQMPEEFWDKMFNVNVKGMFHCLKAVIPSMIERRSGRIINISSVTGPMVSVVHSSAYCATKAAISGLTRALALELAEYGITANAICPGYVKTPGSQYLAEKERKIGLVGDALQDPGNRLVLPQGRG